MDYRRTPTTADGRSRRSRDPVMNAVSVVEVRIEHVLVDGVALLRIDLARVLVRETIQRLLDRDAHCGSCLLPLGPIKYELLSLEDGENLLGDSLDLRLFVDRDVGPRAGEQIEDCKLLFRRRAETARASSSVRERLA